MEILRHGWKTPVARGYVRSPRTFVSLATHGVHYERLEMRQVSLSHAAGLFLLQGASVRQLLEGAAIHAADGEVPFVGTPVLAEVPPLYRPPLVLPRVVFARLTEEAKDSVGNPLSEEQIAEFILRSELSS